MMFFGMIMRDGGLRDNPNGGIPTYADAIALVVLASFLRWVCIFRGRVLVCEQCRYRRMSRDDHATAFSKTCKRCGGRSELALTLSDPRYDVYQCRDCKFVDWISREAQGYRASSVERGPSNVTQ